MRVRRDQEKRIYALDKEKAIWQEEKREICLKISKGRTRSWQLLTEAEGDVYIAIAEAMDIEERPSIKLRRLFIKLSELAEKVWGSKEDWNNYSYCQLNNWCIEYSFLHKELIKYSLAEFPALISQFEKQFKEEIIS